MTSHVFFVLIFIFGHANCSIVNNLITRTISLKDQYARLFSRITLQNDGDEPETGYTYILQPDEVGKLVLFDAVLADGKTTLDFNFVSPSEAFITFEEPLRANETLSIGVYASFAHALHPNPNHIKQNEQQQLLYNGNTVLYSKYPTTKQNTIVSLKRYEKFIRHTNREPTQLEDSTLSYGPYSDTKPNTISSFEVVIFSRTLLLAVTNLTREYEISHWGNNLALHDSVNDLVNQGARLDGGFSRAAYEGTRTPNAVLSYDVRLHDNFTDLYFRDETGNISTSHISEGNKGKILSLFPRYPLLGGWKTAFEYGGNLPLSDLMTFKGDIHRLSVPFNPVVYDVLFEEITVKFILPEDVSSFRIIHVPFEHERLPDERRKTYLDTKGRLVVSFRAKNIPGNLEKSIHIQYSFKQKMILHEPLLLIGGIFAVFLFFIGFIRMSFRIGPETDRIGENAQLIISRFLNDCTQFSNLHNEIISLSIDKSIEQLHTQFDETHRKLIIKLKDLAVQVEAYDQVLAEKCDKCIAKAEERYKTHFSLLNLESKKNPEVKKISNAEKAYETAAAEFDCIIEDIDFY